MTWREMKCRRVIIAPDNRSLLAANGGPMRKKNPAAIFTNVTDDSIGTASATMPLQDADPGKATPLDASMMLRALALATRAAQIGEVPVGAVVYRGEEILGEGFNLRESQADPTAHAEIIALREAAKKLGTWRLDECTIAVTLEPCPMCAGAMINGRLKRLIYGAADPKMGCVHTLYQLVTDPRFNHRLQVTAGIEVEACSQVLKDFFAARRGSEKPAKPRPR